MREHLGADVPLMVDANTRWTADEAIRAARALAAHDVFWVEEPTIPDDVPGHVRVVREGGLPVTAVENLRTVHEFKRLIDAGGVTFPEPDVSNVGGVTPWLKVAHVAEAHNLPVTSHGVHDLHVHLLAAVPNASYLEVHGFGLSLSSRTRSSCGTASAGSRPADTGRVRWKGLECLRAP
jgi:L-alanine-DL-glutamate epimerase-like enolase superfamily enzyme